MTYPVDTNDGLLEAVNYLLSGPTSLGQNFEGMSATGDAVLNSFGDVVVPSGAVWVTGTNNLPFVSDTIVTIPDPATGPWPTDCNAQVSVTGPTDRVFLSNYINAAFDYINGDGAGCEVQLFLTRYKAYVRDTAIPFYPPYNTNIPAYGKNQLDPLDANYSWYFDAALLGKSRVEVTSVSPPNGTVALDNIFVNIIDSPGIGFYWYVIELQFYPAASTAEVTSIKLGERSFTAQVIKR